MKRILTAIFGFILLLTATFCFVSQTAQALSEGDYLYLVRDGEAIVVDAAESLSGKVELPQKLGGYPVVCIGENAFYNCQSITEITIPKSCKTIESAAFYNCSSLEKVKVEGKLSAVATSAFDNTPIVGPKGDWQDGVLYFQKFILASKPGLRKIVIRSGVKTIPQGVFGDNESLVSVTLPDSVTTIENHAFSRCTNLDSIKIGNGIMRVGSGVFSNTAYYNDENNWDNGILYLKDYLLDVKKDISGEVKIKRNTRVIADYAFGGYSGSCGDVTSIKLPEGLVVIGERSFSNCDGLTEITLPASLKTVHEEAFANCDSILVVTVKGKNTVFEKEVFDYCRNLELMKLKSGSKAEQVVESLGINHEYINAVKSFTQVITSIVTHPLTGPIYVIIITVYAVVLTVLFVVSRLKAIGKNKKSE